ncbi:MAG TPA: glycosyltransferase family 39 protein [Candidatus Kryptonia bacterium]|nr:glycosyltransferase family 39 protein [Candidatus Kryptonia bacterium]
MTTAENAQVAAVAARRSGTRPLLLALAGALAVSALWAATQLWGLGKEPFHTHGEAREALVVWQITHGGGWILPLRDGPTGVEVPSKPPLFHWMGALTALAHGRTDEWSIRLPSVALSLAGALTTYAAGVGLWGPPAGFVAAVATLTSFEWQRAATGARVDMTLTFGLAAALLAYLFFLRSGRTGWLIPFYAGMAFGSLAKGPVGVALPAAQVAVMCTLQRDVSPLRRMQLRRGLITVAIVVGAWYVLALLTGGVAFFAKQILNENIYRFAEAAEYEGGHRHGALYLLGGLAAGWLPWTLFLPGTLGALWQRRRELSTSDPRVYLLSWIAIVFTFYAIAVSKRSVYLLSLYPALGLLTGWWWATCLTPDDGATEPRWLRAALRPVAQLAAVLLALLLAAVAVEVAHIGVVNAIASRLKLDAEAQLNVAWVTAGLRRNAVASMVLLGGGSAALWWLASTLRRPRWRAAFAATLIAFCAVETLIRQIVMPEIAAHETYRDIMPAVREVVGDQAALSFYRAFEYEAVFYWGDHIAVYSGDLSIDAPRYLLISSEEWQRATVAQREHFERIALPNVDEASNPRRLFLVKKRDG